MITESEQITGSFKLRGAFNKLLSLKELNDEVLKEAITASTGNHGAATVSEGYIIYIEDNNYYYMPAREYEFYLRQGVH